jgi:hypothetical protein
MTLGGFLRPLPWGLKAKFNLPHLMVGLTLVPFIMTPVVFKVRCCRQRWYLTIVAQQGYLLASAVRMHGRFP